MACLRKNQIIIEDNFINALSTSFNLIIGRNNNDNTYVIDDKDNTNENNAETENVIPNKNKEHSNLKLRNRVLATRAKPLSVLTEKLLDSNKRCAETAQEFNKIAQAFSENYLKYKEKKLEFEIAKYKFENPQFRFDY